MVILAAWLLYKHPLDETEEWVDMTGLDSNVKLQSLNLEWKIDPTFLKPQDFNPSGGAKSQDGTKTSGNKELKTKSLTFVNLTALIAPCVWHDTEPYFPERLPFKPALGDLRDAECDRGDEGTDDEVRAQDYTTVRLKAEMKPGIKWHCV